MSSIHMSLIFTNFWFFLFCDFHLHRIHRNHLAKNDLSPVSHKTRGPFLGICFNLLATPSTSLNFQSVALPWFSSPLVPLYPPSLPALTPEEHEVLKDFLLGWLACQPFPAPLSFCDSIYCQDFQYSSVWIIHIISKPSVAPGRGISMSLLDSDLHVFPPHHTPLRFPLSVHSISIPWLQIFWVILIYSLPSLIYQIVIFQPNNSWASWLLSFPTTYLLNSWLFQLLCAIRSRGNLVKRQTLVQEVWREGQESAFLTTPGNAGAVRPL